MAANDTAKQTEPETGEAPKSFASAVKKELREWGATLAVFVPLFLLFSGLFYELRVIPSESMVPNLQVGDRVAVNKFAYGYSRYSFPFSLGRYVPLPDGRILASQPKRGDVAVFEHPHTARVMIKRIIGLPGDEVQLRAGIVFINGKPVDRTLERRVRYIPKDESRRIEADEWRETYDGASWLTHDVQRRVGVENTPVFRVPDNHFLFMGDNRDNSADGRSSSGHCETNAEGVIDQAGCEPRIDPDTGLRYSTEQATIGFVPLTNLIGRADTVLFTTYRCSGVDAEPCMKKRLWRGL